MRIAIPLAEGKLSMHFGHCHKFLLADVDVDKKEILESRELVPPPHEPGILPAWLAEQGAKLIIAGGMGQRAQSLFAEQGIRVLTGAGPSAAEELLNDFLNDRLTVGENACDH